MEQSDEDMLFSLIKIGSVTHNINSDQRRIPHTPVVNGAEAVLTLPGDPGIVFSGAWFLLALNPEDVLSVANTICVRI